MPNLFYTHASISCEIILLFIKKLYLEKFDLIE